MPVPLHDLVPSINFLCECGAHNFRRPRAEPHAPTFVVHATLFFEKRNHRFLRLFIEFSAVGAFNVADVAGKLDGRHLHPEAKAKIWDIVLPSELRGFDFSFDPALAKTAGNQNAGNVF